MSLLLFFWKFRYICVVVIIRQGKVYIYKGIYSGLFSFVFFYEIRLKIVFFFSKMLSLDILSHAKSKDIFFSFSMITFAIFGRNNGSFVCSCKRILFHKSKILSTISLCLSFAYFSNKQKTFEECFFFCNSQKRKINNLH